MTKKKIDGIADNNQGSTLVTVMIIAVFISILTTILIYATTKNYQTKQLDYQNKKNFYAAESALEELRAICVIDCEKASAYAYQQVMMDYANLNGDQREARFKTEFISYLEKIWDDRTTEYDASNGESKVLQAIKQGKLSLSESSIEAITESSDFAIDKEKGFYILKGLKAEVTNVDNYITVITTDICIVVPKLNWGIDNSAVYNGSSEDKAKATSKEKVQWSDYVVFVNWKKD